MNAEALERWRPAMLRFAQLHLQPREEAEDAVQDCLLAALAAPSRAVDDARAYLFGVLKHKITDRLRERYRHGRPAEDAGEASAEDLDGLLFDPRGRWATGMAPEAWGSPEAALASEQFFAVVDACVGRLPAKTARVFSMKALLDCDTDEVRATLGLSASDYWQCMSRARQQIQLCLTQRWFGAPR